MQDTGCLSSGILTIIGHKLLNSIKSIKIYVFGKFLHLLGVWLRNSSVTFNPGVSTECRRDNFHSHGNASMKRGTATLRCSRETGGCFIMISTSRRCDVMLQKLWLCKSRNIDAADEFCPFQTQGRKGLNQSIVGCVCRPIQKRWSEWQ